MRLPLPVEEVDEGRQALLGRRLGPDARILRDGLHARPRLVASRPQLDADLARNLDGVRSTLVRRYVCADSTQHR